MSDAGRSAGERDRSDHPLMRPTYESAIDRTIREAMEEGKFDDLPFRGDRLPGRDERGGEWTTAFEMLRNAGFAPPWIEADKEARRRLTERDALLDQAESAGRPVHATLRRRMREIVEAANRAIDQLNALAPTLSQHRRRLDPAAELDELERRLRS